MPALSRHLTDVFLVGGAAASAVWLLSPHMRRSQVWRAIVTPLASIIGSGFLVAGPVLGAVAGSLAWLAMLGLCAVAYVFGEAVRHNIAHVEPLLSDGAPTHVGWIERASQLALSLAYFVSVAYYLELFAAFGLRLFDIVDPVAQRSVSTVAIGVIGAIGTLGGLRSLERLEIWAVSLKLAIIVGICAALGLFAGIALHDGSWGWPRGHDLQGAEALRVLLGLVILVQGFETSRFLGDAYDAPTRIKTMRQAQWIATGVYLIFILLVTPLLDGELPARGGETAIIDLLSPVAALIGPLLVLAALASQSSAAVADMNGAAGLLGEASRGRLSVRYGNLVTAVAAIAITWSGSIYDIITYASRAFVVYYALQSAQAFLSARTRGQHGRMWLFGTGVLIAVLVVGLAKSVEG